ncbi:MULTISPECIES: tRNA pseudouridine(55) synthase TruB [Saccharopolyspora]|uniref:tRNA pseudouridine synthase B n=1 Tax=Saccharopolyspora gregorii TaxID=33914 RepID=A0ABP6RKN3_9PSEU|nr:MULTISPECIES: tRNA pseudouridine(55) synthase TruB [unclassified Saccharopolyspora]MCA1186868.1 tRNA pseudouridine(55) synthase TruB [Saccharopolyspora sp. 6T]MCA1193369.1 tRNA pseudouridine(55) synthase TruB [Saccharopolyspora sp. 6V]MCA1228322.1 tRNA pseudouridine(55) synthase TruB [Saccharopolyspora sp. 6M]MCA1282090.1 tRNA pseudouridine(55) synthase TruB [Saccharopolyspora sp. 7B]
MSEHSRTARNRPAVPPGLLVVDKPSGMTSHDVVSRVRRIMGTRKVGHAGTLDPMATGVLVLGLERATKLLGHLALDTKAYLATIRLGAATSTDDAEGEVRSRTDPSGVTEQAVRDGIAELTGDIQQVPSSVSAVKVNGKRAYELAREGKDVELAARPVTVSRFDLLALREPAEATGEPDEDRFVELDVLVECSSGTYVRALARDLGARLGVGGHLGELRRTRVGPFGLATARTLEQLEAEPGLSMDLDRAIATAFARHDTDAVTVRALMHGQTIPATGVAGTCGVFGPDGRAVALVQDQGRTARPVLVLTPAG